MITLRHSYSATAVTVWQPSKMVNKRLSDMTSRHYPDSISIPNYCRRQPFNRSDSCPYTRWGRNTKTKWRPCRSYLFQWRPFRLKPHDIVPLSQRCIELLLKQSSVLNSILLGGPRGSDKDQTLLILTQTGGIIEPHMLSSIRTPSNAKHPPVIWEQQIYYASPLVTI